MFRRQYDELIVTRAHQRLVLLGQIVFVSFLFVVGLAILVVVVLFAHRRRVVLHDLGLFAGHAVRLAFGLPFRGHDARGPRVRASPG